MTISSSALEACKNAEAVVIATEWKEFKEIPWEQVYAGMNKPAFVFDGRLLVDHAALTKIGFKVCHITPISRWRLTYFPPFRLSRLVVALSKVDRSAASNENNR